MAFLKKYWLAALTVVCTGLIGWTGVVYGQPVYRMLRQNPGQITFLIYAIHAFLCITIQFFSVRRLFAEQRKEQAYENHPS